MSSSSVSSQGAGSAGDAPRSRVLVAMSGGVDSSVAAAMCLEAGHEVTGVTLKLWGGPQDQGCCAVSDVDDARRVCQQLGIDHFVFNYGDEFEAKVVEPYVAAHAAGLTPNPCISCNRYLKFDALAHRARQLGFDRLATGHHVRVQPATGADRNADRDTSDASRAANAPARLLRGADPSKDQSYVLYMLSAADLAWFEFPVGDLTKDQVRSQAKSLGLRTADKPDSQDVCFITAAQGRGNFLTERLQLHTGQLVSTAGETVGEVPAVELVTIGQRKGLDLGGNSDRHYAIDVDIKQRRVVVGSEKDLLSDGVALDDHRWVASKRFAGDVLAQTSAHGTAQSASLDSQGQLRWLEPQPRVAPGQAVVFYDNENNEVVIGGATAQRS